MPSDLSRLVPDAPTGVLDLLDPGRGALEPPLRSEVFGRERFAQHGRSLGATHHARAPSMFRRAPFFPRLHDNIRMLRLAHRYIGEQARTGVQLSPAAEWLLDNFHLIEAQLKEIRDGLPRRYFRHLPVLIEPPLAGLPRVYGVAWAFVAHTDGAFDDDLLEHFLAAYQQARPLALGELWALPTTLRVVLIEGLRRLAERLATHKAARELANLVGDHLERWTPPRLDELVALLNQRGVGRVFLLQVAQRLQDERALTFGPLHGWLLRALPELAEAQVQQPAEQASDNLSVSNAIGSLRLIGNADWPEIVSRASATMQLLLGSPIFEAERGDTRDATLHAIEHLAQRSGRSEPEVTHAVLELMHAERRPEHGPEQGPSHWLLGRGRPVLLQRLGLHERTALAWAALQRHTALPAYLAALAAGSLALVAWMSAHHAPGTAPWLAWASAALMLWPASETVIALVNRLISESTRPSRLPRLALAQGIPADQRVLVVIPGMLTSPAAARELAHRLELHHLANPERHAQFALLTDWADAPTETRADDDTLLDEARLRIAALNARHPNAPDQAPRFILLHRRRRFSATQQRWIGWERKRGKLEQLVALLADPSTRADAAFIELGEASRVEPQTRYLVTLDGDTQLPPGRLRELVGVAAHPHNQPVVDPATRRVTRGYAILQPHVATPLPTRRDATLYHWLFAGQCGIDPYSAASSEVYQDIFREGSFSGKGLFNVAAVHAVLHGRLPEDSVLSHDLLEGALSRCAAVTDVAVIEDAPFHADVAASRVHRWTRGDWQLLPFLLQPARYPMRAVNRWKIIDNLRRSLVAPASLAWLLLVLASGVIAPGAALALVAAAFGAGPLMGAVAALAPSRDDIAKGHFYTLALGDLLRAACAAAWQLAQLPRLAATSADAAVRALYRLLISRRGLLEWTTAAAAQAAASTELRVLARQHAGITLAAVAAWAALLALGTPHPVWSTLLCALWAASPVWTWWVSRRRPARRDAALPAADKVELETIARDTWRLFERCVGEQDRHLPPDNLQMTPHAMVAHRTSPTNIGLYMLSAACARRFGWIGTHELIDRLSATLATLATLTRHRGHFLNWYDTQSGAALLPMYVSTVDSGNLSGTLLAVAQACRELALAPHDPGPARHALRASQLRLAPLQQGLTGALARLLALPDPLADADEALLRDAATELAPLLAADDTSNDASNRTANSSANTATDGTPPTHLDELARHLADHLATLRSALRDRHDPADGAGHQLHALAARCEALAWEADYGFLYHRKRRLLHIGYRVAEQQLDSSLYDLLASESRLTSLLAIAKGDLPVSHWAALGRPFYAVGADAGLRSWSGSMFEYLMPTLLLDEPHGSVLAGAGHAALREQITYAREHGVPWGISESAYAASDHTLAYQYAPQGVPRLSLRRTPQEELVIAPYATALAAQIAPHRAVANFAALARLGARSRYGYVEALDFTPARQPDATGHVRVDTYMAHHQGMSIVAIANVLLDGLPRRWGMGNPHVEAVSSLLHERAPREVSVLLAPPPVAADEPAMRLPGMLREVMPGVATLAPTQMLSNGRYHVSLRANGAGWSRWGRSGIARWRDDALRDAHGSFLYLRWDRQPQAVSLTQHPAPDPTAHYQTSYQADRVVFDARWPEISARTTVWVSPEDDIEFRQVELRNRGDRALTLELMSAFEITLADPRADEAHPAFSNLFLRARWLGAQQALMFERKPRLPGEPGLHAAHFITSTHAGVGASRVQAQRLRWAGRNHDASQPLALFPDTPAGDADAELDTGLDPVCALATAVRLEPRATVRLTICTAASDQRDTLVAVIDKYRHPAPIARSSLMSATLTGIRLRELNIAVETFAAVQSLTTAIVLTLPRPRPAEPEAATEPGAARCDKRALWRFGISGDRPIVLVSASAPHSRGLLRALMQALRLWSWAGLACDLVVINAEPSSYLMALQREVNGLQEQLALQGGAPDCGFHVLRADELSAAERATLTTLARLHFNADGRPLTQHVDDWLETHENALAERQAVSVSALPVAPGGGAALQPPQGRFVAASGEFQFEVGPLKRPVRPWINVLANPGFGAQISEAGGGYSWALNSRLNQLTPWSNDAIADPSGEWFVVQDLKTRELWSVTPSAAGDASSVYRIAHGQGLSRIRHRRGDLDIGATWCVDAESGVKQIRLRVINRGHRTRRLRLIGVAEWIMGAGRADRASTLTGAFTQRLAHGADTPPRRVVAVSCTQRDHAAGFGNGTAFLALIDAMDEAPDWTADRQECFDARGRFVVPDEFGQRAGGGLDPCAALAARRTLGAGETVECVFLLGFGVDPVQARNVAIAAAGVPAATRLANALAHWDELLGATTVATPDPLFDAMVNRWLLYQTIACRLWAKAGFYQAGGAFGFRDQLQDAMALAWPAPQMLRTQILVNASRQFAEGDVQHWWHAPTGAGVRTHFSDDLLWLPHACAHYLATSGDASVLDERVPFIEAGPIPAGAEDAYTVPAIGTQTATVFEHAARALDHSLTRGAHGLPLMGTGDWNDGMNRVGAEGRGESVWLGWFLCKLVEDFAPIAIARGETERAHRWQEAARGWRDALLGTAWDGQWFKRAFFDDGTPLGSHVNAECQIDLIAQAWSVMSGIAPASMRRMAMAAMEVRLVDADAGLIKLLAPPLQDASPSAGYIQAYPRGVRENGGQYSHAGVWALIAQAMRGHGDAAYRYFTYLSPAHRAADPKRGPRYEIEPYVMAGDVYASEPYVGRGGWSWYTGSAAWLHRAAIEHLFGVRVRGAEIALSPCLPSHWPHAQITLTRAGRTLRVVLCRPVASGEIDRARSDGAVERAAGETWVWDADDAPRCVLMRLPTGNAHGDAEPVVEASRPRPTGAGASLRWAADEAVSTVGPSTTP